MALEVVIMIGLQASGKSTFSRASFAQTHQYISRDQFSKATKNPKNKQRSLIEAALTAGKSVVVDNTSPSREARAEIIEIANRFEARCVGYYFESKVQDCLARNQLRAGASRVPDVAIFTTIKRLERPSLGEGFEALYYVKLNPEGGFLIEPWSEEPL